MATPPRGREAQYGQSPRLRAITAGLALLLTFAILGPLMSYSELPLAGEGSPVRQLVYVVAFGLAVWGARPIGNPRVLLVVPATILVMLAWCWISMAWAVEPGIAVRRLILTCLVIWTLFIAADRLGYDRTVAILRIALAITLVANFAAVLVSPEFGIHQIAEPGDKRLIGDWRGIMMHKNFAGAISAVTILAFALDARRILLPLRIAVIAAAGVFLIFSASKTSQGLLIPALAAGLLFQSYNAKYRTAVIAAVCVAGVGAATLFSLYRNPFAFDLDDRDAFTGRTQIWQALARYSGDHSLTGAGYGSFWNIGPTSPIYQYASGWVTEVTSGHNGFMDLLITVGVPGVVLAFIATLVAPLFRLLTSKAIPVRSGALVIALILFSVGHNTTESSLFDRDTIVEVILMLAIALLRPLSAEVTRRSDVSMLFSHAKSRPRPA